jgi:hypothetical protein
MQAAGGSWFELDHVTVESVQERALRFGLAKDELEAEAQGLVRAGQHVVAGPRVGRR